MVCLRECLLACLLDSLPTYVNSLSYLFIEVYHLLLVYLPICLFENA